MTVSSPVTMSYCRLIVSAVQRSAEEVSTLRKSFSYEDVQWFHVKDHTLYSVSILKYVDLFPLFAKQW